MPTRLSRQQLHDLASAGAVAQIQEIERRLSALHAEWPELFLSPTAPVLLVADRKPSTNGAWPPVLKHAAPPPTTPRSEYFTPQLRRLVEQHPTGISTRELGPSFPDKTLDAISVALSSLVARGLLRRVRTGVYAPATARRRAAPVKVKPKKKKSSGTWTPARRALMAAHMRRRHAAGEFVGKTGRKKTAQ